jgi:hypothetical protein
MASLITSQPISEHHTRERTFALINLRPDFNDVIAQFVIMLEQMHKEKFTGSWVINFGQGAINNTKVIETKKGS